MNEESNRKLIRNSIKTPDGTILTSRTRHDYNTYTDSNGLVYMVDGGLSYLRRNLHVAAPYVETSLYTDHPHEVLRDEIVWGSISGDVKIKNMSKAHINNIIEDGYRGVYIELMEAELAFREGTESKSEAKRLEIQREGAYG